MADELAVSPPMVLLRPGDRVLVAFTEDLDSLEAQEMAQTLRTAFPGVDFTVMAGVASVLVRGGD